MAVIPGTYTTQLAGQAPGGEDTPTPEDREPVESAPEPTQAVETAPEPVEDVGTLEPAPEPVEDAEPAPETVRADLEAIMNAMGSGVSRE